MPAIKVMGGAHIGFQLAPLAIYAVLVHLILAFWKFASPNLLDMYIGAGMIVVSIVGLVMPATVGKRTPVLTHVLICCILIGFTIVWIIGSTVGPYTVTVKMLHGVAIGGLGSLIVVLCVLNARVPSLETVAAPLLIPRRQNYKLLPVLLSSSAAALCLFGFFVMVTTSKVVKANAMTKGGFFEEEISSYMSEGFAIAIPILSLVSVLMSAAVLIRHPFEREGGHFNINNILMSVVAIFATTSLIGAAVFTTGEGQTNYRLKSLFAHLVFTTFVFVFLFAYELTTSFLMLHNIIAGTVRKNVQYCGLVGLNILASMATGMFFCLWAAQGMTKRNYLEWLAVCASWIGFVLVSVVASCTEAVPNDTGEPEIRNPRAWQT